MVGAGVEEEERGGEGLLPAPRWLLAQRRGTRTAWGKRQQCIWDGASDPGLPWEGGPR